MRAVNDLPFAGASRKGCGVVVLARRACGIAAALTL
jgi:hypothetical protein